MKHGYLYIVALMTILMFPSSGYARDYGQTAIVIDKSFQFANITHDLHYIEDRSGDMTVEEVSCMNAGWKVVGENTVRFGYSRSAFWYRFTLDDRRSTGRDIYLELNFPTMDFIDLYIPAGKGQWLHKQQGDHRPFSFRDIPDRHFIFTIPAVVSSHAVYVRVKSLGAHKYSFLVQTPEIHLERKNRLEPAYWMLWGCFLLLIAFNIFLFVSTREWVYLAFIILAASAVLHHFFVRGFATQYYLQSPGRWNDVLIPFFFSLMVFSGMIMYRLLIGSKKHFPRFDWFFKWSTMIPSGIIIILSLFLPVNVTMPAGFILYLIQLVFLLILIILALMKKIRQVYFFMAGFLPLFIISVPTVLMPLGYWSGNFLSLYSVEFTHLGFFFFSSLGLVDRMNTMKKDLEKSERQVREQNNELTAANEELMATNEEFEAQNEELLTAYHNLEIEERRFSEMTGMLPQLIYEMEMNGRLTYVNDFGFSLTGYTRQDLERGVNALDLLIPEDRKRAAENFIGILSSSDVHPHEYTVLHRDGIKIPVLIYTRPIIRDGTACGFRGVIIDIRERKKAEAMLIQSEKMMTVGGLAAGMAHEINNPLGIILQGVQNTFRRFSPEREANRKEAQDLGIDLETVNRYMEKRGITYYLRSIDEAGRRAADIIAHMLNFSRKSDQEFTSCDIHEVIDEAIALAEKDYDLKKKYDFRHMEIIRAYDRQLPFLEIQKTELEQVLLNLLKNAAQAMGSMQERERQPRITITTGRSGSSAVITIADNGPGMDDEMCRHIFEPFFTTKPVGEGTGLGLSVAYFIVTRNHGGSIDVSSRKGAGTSFVITLPFSHV